MDLSKNKAQSHQEQQSPATWHQPPCHPPLSLSLSLSLNSKWKDNVSGRLPEEWMTWLSRQRILTHYFSLWSSLSIYISLFCWKPFSLSLLCDAACTA
uniref:Uncharacterized protein n=1 Tax=Oryza brachyantha TaxID=4533 RepID=J3MWP6_ORYBR